MKMEMELLAPAGSGEAVVAAVQSGADAIYLPVGPGWTPAADVVKSVRYCRVRGCRVYLYFPDLYVEQQLGELTLLVEKALRHGASACIVQDLGLARILRQILPDLALFAAPQLNVYDKAGILTLQALGFSRAFLAPELDLMTLSKLIHESPIPLGMLLQGERCLARGGSCRFADALEEKNHVGPCSHPCRQELSMGGRMDSYPLTVKDFCLLRYLDGLQQAGVAMGVLGRVDTRPEQIAVSCRMAVQFLRQGKRPTDRDMELMENAFSRFGYADGDFFNWEPPQKILSVPPILRAEREGKKYIADIRKSYADGELRRVPVRFAVRLHPGRHGEFAVIDCEGNRAMREGPVPRPAQSTRALTPRAVQDLFRRTAGTPYLADEVICDMSPGLYLSEDRLAQIQRELLQALSEARHNIPTPRVCPSPESPPHEEIDAAPALAVSLTRADQLSDELAALRPELLYLPLDLLASDPAALASFREAGSLFAAVLPGAVDPAHQEDFLKLLRDVRDMGVDTVVAENIGQVLLCRSLGFAVRGGLGLQVTNANALQLLRDTRLQSALLSPRMNLHQVRTLRKPLPTELIVYGRLPVMLADRCIIKKSAGRCACQNTSRLTSKEGASFPVRRQFGCKNMIYDNKKIFLADRRRDYEQAGLQAVQLLMTEESTRECVEIVRAYRGLSERRPNGSCRGRYYDEYRMH